MILAKNIYIGLLAASIVILGLGMFYGDLMTTTNSVGGNIGIFNESEAIFEQTEALKNQTEAVTAEESENFDRAASFVGGIFQVAKLPLTATSAISHLITSFTTELKMPGLAIVAKIMLLAIGIALLIDFILFVRGVVR